MLTRTEAERVLSDYRISRMGYNGTGNAYQELTDKLCALSPPPSREALEQLWEIHDHQYASAKAWREAMFNAIMAWAAGKAVRKVWCEHMEQGSDGIWNLRGGFRFAGVEAARLKFCPECAAPSPR